MLLQTCSGGTVGHLDTARSLAPANRGGLPPIQVAVFAPSDINESLVNQICAETEAIWGPAGIKFDWHRVTSKDAARTWQLAVAIDRHRRPNPQGALGWIKFTPDGPDKSIHLSSARAEELLLETPGFGNIAIVTRETLIGRALGRALSHELGHYLLKSKAHTPRGLMRAIWPSDEFFAIRRNGFELTAGERQAAARNQGILAPRWRSD